MSFEPKVLLNETSIVHFSSTNMMSCAAVTFEFAEVYRTNEDQSIRLSINLTEGFLPFDVDVTLTSISEAGGLQSTATGNVLLMTNNKTCMN